MKIKKRLALLSSLLIITFLVYNSSANAQRLTSHQIDSLVAKSMELMPQQAGLAIVVVKDGEVTPIGATGIPVGMFCSAEYDVERFKFDKNDFLFLYTDGLSEASVNETEYGTDRIKEHVAELNGLSAKEVITKVLVKQQTFLVHTKLEDDITVAAIRKI